MVLHTDNDDHRSLDLRTERRRKGEKLRGDSLVPVGLGITVQRREHDGQDLGGVVADQAHDVLIVPVVQSSLCHLTAQEVLAYRQA